jgi:hypothetical protein
VPIKFSDYTFVEDLSSKDAAARGDGSVLVPVSVFDGAPPDSVSVVDLAGREVSYELCGRTFFVDSDAGVDTFAGWSYWESEDTDTDYPCVELFILSPDFEESAYPRR